MHTRSQTASDSGRFPHFDVILFENNKQNETQRSGICFHEPFVNYPQSPIMSAEKRKADSPEPRERNYPDGLDDYNEDERVQESAKHSRS